MEGNETSGGELQARPARRHLTGDRITDKFGEIGVQTASDPRDRDQTRVLPARVRSASATAG